MNKILTPEQEKIVMHYKNTYPDMILMSPKERAILDNPRKFTQTNMPRLDKELEKKAVQVFDEIDFLIKNLPAYYKFKILSSGKCKKFFETVIDTNDVGLSKLDDKTRDLVICFADQLCMDTIAVLITTMPEDFKKPLKNSVMPFVNLLKAIASYGQAKSLKDIPKIKIKIPNLLIVEGQE